jgi:hypothetical protein
MFEMCVNQAAKPNVGDYVGSTTEMINVNPRTPYQ